jgi:hypothetical protein
MLLRRIAIATKLTQGSPLKPVLSCCTLELLSITCFTSERLGFRKDTVPGGDDKACRSWLSLFQHYIKGCGGNEKYERVVLTPG